MSESSSSSPSWSGAWCSALCGRLESLWRECSLCDTAVLLCDDVRVRPAHACVLAAASPILRAALTPAAPGCFSLRLDLPAPVWDAVVLFIYTGRLQPGAQLAEVNKAARLLHLEELEHISEATTTTSSTTTTTTPKDPSTAPMSSEQDTAVDPTPDPPTETGSSGDGQKASTFSSPDSISAVIDRLIHFEKSDTPAHHHPQHDAEYPMSVATSGGGGSGGGGGGSGFPPGPPVFPFPSLMDAAVAAGNDAVGVSASLAGIGLKPESSADGSKSAGMRSHPPATTGSPLTQAGNSSIWRAVYQSDGTFRGYEPYLQNDGQPQDGNVRNGQLSSVPSGQSYEETKASQWLGASPSGSKSSWMSSPPPGGESKLTLQCRVCGKGFTRARSLADHERTHSNERPYACSTCGKTFTLARYLACHEKRHLAAAEKGRLGGVLSDRSLSESMSGMCEGTDGGEEGAYECATCAVCFGSPTALARHNAAVHGSDSSPNGQRPHACATCGKTFAARYLLAHHERTHSGERPYACTTCGKTFARADILSRHASVHTGARPHTCGVCGKSFSRAAELACHRRAHTGERPFACYACGARFANSSSLCRHRRVHTGARPHACEICGRGFAHRYVLRHHERTHTGERPYACDVCGRAFTRNDILARHKTTHIASTAATSSSTPDHNERGLLKCRTCDKTFAHRGALLYHERTHALLPPPPAPQANPRDVTPPSQMMSPEVSHQPQTNATV